MGTHEYREKEMLTEIRKNVAIVIIIVIIIVSSYQASTRCGVVTVF